MTKTFDVQIKTSINEISAQQWQQLDQDGNPFLSYAFLAALENHDCLDKWGWLPRFITLFDSNQQLIAALPMYLKDNSYGEFVFDWAWADAYSRQGLRYYPKLVVSVPFTPATGPRLLTHQDHDAMQLRKWLMDAALDYAKSIQVSSLHYLFTTDTETDQLEQAGLLRRSGCQFHWQNNHYQTFDDFLYSLL